jgi:hypothetical protein
MPAEKRLIAELKDCDQGKLAARSALTKPQHLVFPEEHRKLTQAVELAEGKGDAVRVRLRALRAAKRRQKDSHDVHQLQNGLNKLGEEIDSITYADEVTKEQEPSPDVTLARQERYCRLEMIRDKLAKLKSVMESFGRDPKSLDLP